MRFLHLYNALTVKLDGMGHRIDDLEKNIADLMSEAGIEDEHRT